jgi:hypothetical protein
VTSPTGARPEISTEVSRQLAVVPTVTAVLTVVAAVAGGYLIGLAATDAGAVLVWVGSVLIGLALVSGIVVGHQLGLVALVIATQIPGSTTGDGIGEGAEAMVDAGGFGVTGGPTGQLVAIVVWILIVHELGRLSLDARRPARFAPGFLRRFALAPIAVAGGLAVAAVAVPPITDWDLPPVLVPVGLAALALPLVTRRWVQGMPVEARSATAARLAVGVLAVAVTLGAVAVGAQARAGIENERTSPPASTTTDTTTPDATATTVVEPVTVEPNPLGRAIVIALMVVAIVVAGMLYAAFRRPEEVYELDDLVMDDDDRSLGLARPGEAELDDHQTVLDEREMTDLLDELQLDLLSEPDPGRAVRFGYATIERRLGGLGIERREDETEQELLARALPVLVDSAPLVALTTLFEHARFSHEPVTEPMRARALAAIDELRQQTVSAS